MAAFTGFVSLCCRPRRSELIGGRQIGAVSLPRRQNISDYRRTCDPQVQPRSFCVRTNTVKVETRPHWQSSGCGASHARAAAELALPGRWWRPPQGDSAQALQGVIMTLLAEHQFAAMSAVLLRPCAYSVHVQAYIRTRSALDWPVSSGAGRRQAPNKNTGASINELC